MKLSEKIQRTTPYSLIAVQLGVSSKFVGMIARGERNPSRGKGLEVKKELEKLVSSYDEISTNK